MGRGKTQGIAILGLARFALFVRQFLMACLVEFGRAWNGGGKGERDRAGGEDRIGKQREAGDLVGKSRRQKCRTDDCDERECDARNQRFRARLGAICLVKRQDNDQKRGCADEDPHREFAGRDAECRDSCKTDKGKGGSIEQHRDPRAGIVERQLRRYVAHGPRHHHRAGDMQSLLRQGHDCAAEDQDDQSDERQCRPRGFGRFTKDGKAGEPRDHDQSGAREQAQHQRLGLLGRGKRLGFPHAPSGRLDRTFGVKRDGRRGERVQSNICRLRTANVHQGGRTGLVVGHNVKQPRGSRAIEKAQNAADAGLESHDAVEFLLCRVCEFQRQPSPFAIVLGRDFSLRRAVERFEPRRHVGNIAVERDRCRRKSVSPTKRQADQNDGCLRQAIGERAGCAHAFWDGSAKCGRTASPKCRDRACIAQAGPKG